MGTSAGYRPRVAVYFGCGRRRKNNRRTFKFSANEQIVLHRHVAAFNTFVVRGEHRIYNPDGELTEVRPVGTYKARLPNIEPHREGGGDEDVIILFSLRPYDNGPIYEVLDEDHEILSTMTFDDLKAMYEST